MSDKEAFIQGGKIGVNEVENFERRLVKIRSLKEIMDEQKENVLENFIDNIKSDFCHDQELIDNLYYSIGMALEIPKPRQKEIDVYLINLLHEKKVISKALWQIYNDSKQANECIYSLYMYGIMVSENNHGSFSSTKI